MQPPPSVRSTRRGQSLANRSTGRGKWKLSTGRRTSASPGAPIEPWAELARELDIWIEYVPVARVPGEELAQCGKCGLPCAAELADRLAGAYAGTF